MKLEQVSIASIHQDDENVRVHPDRNLQAIKDSLEQFGQQKPIVVSEVGVIIAGNGTHEAALALGWKKISVVRSELRDSAAVAYAIADNKTTDLGFFDDDLLSASLKGLAEDGVDLSKLGFDDKELVSFLADKSTEFKELDEDIEVNCQCPKCGYRWNDSNVKVDL